MRTGAVSTRRSDLMAWIFLVMLLLQEGESLVNCRSGSVRSSQSWGTTPSKKSVPLFSSLRSKNNNDEDHPVQSSKKGEIRVSTSIDLPFPAEVAFDAFSDLSRQPTFSPWLRSVEYLDENRLVGSTTRWTMAYLGLRFSWNAISTRQDRENGVIEWKSLTGLENSGRVKFQPAAFDDGMKSHMRMTMSFKTPRLAARFLGERNSIAMIVEERMLHRTLQNFRDIVHGTDWRLIQQQEEDKAQQSAALVATKDDATVYTEPISRQFEPVVPQ